MKVFIFLYRNYLTKRDKSDKIQREACRDRAPSILLLLQRHHSTKGLHCPDSRAVAMSNEVVQNTDKEILSCAPELVSFLFQVINISICLLLGILLTALCTVSLIWSPQSFRVFAVSHTKSLRFFETLNG